MATNLSCINFGIAKLDSNVDPMCSQILKDEANYAKKMMDEVHKVSKGIMIAKLEEIVKTAPSSVNFELLPRSNTTFEFVPRCINPLDKWSEKDKNLIRKKGSFLNTSSYEVDVPYYAMKMGLIADQYLRLSMDLRFEVSGHYTMIIGNLNDFSKNGKGDVTLRKYQSGVGRDTSSELKICSQ